mgnify:CR=1 FL=1
MFNCNDVFDLSHSMLTFALDQWLTPQMFFYNVDDIESSSIFVQLILIIMPTFIDSLCFLTKARMKLNMDHIFHQ